MPSELYASVFAVREQNGDRSLGSRKWHGPRTDLQAAWIDEFTKSMQDKNSTALWSRSFTQTATAKQNDTVSTISTRV